MSSNNSITIDSLNCSDEIKSEIRSLHVNILKFKKNIKAMKRNLTKMNKSLLGPKDLLYLNDLPMEFKQLIANTKEKILTETEALNSYIIDYNNLIKFIG